MSIDDFKRTAFRNATSSIGWGKRFPHKIFVGQWIDYLFFNSDALFDARFIDVKKLLMEEEHSSAIAVANLGNVNGEAVTEPRAIFLDRNTTAQHYIDELMGDRTATSWMFLMDRYVCASDKGNWCIYCEKENDLAVLAVGEEIARFTCLQVAKLLGGKSMRSGSMSGEGFDFDKLVPEWKVALQADYKPVNQSD